MRRPTFRQMEAAVKVLRWLEAEQADDPWNDYWTRRTRFALIRQIDKHYSKPAAP